MKKLNLLFLIVCLIFSASQGLAQNKKKDKEQQQQMANALITKDTIKFHPEEVVIGGVYKVVAYEKNGFIEPKIKISGTIDKLTNPGFKKVTFPFSPK